MKKVFIVDDNEANLLIARKALDGTYETFAMPSAGRMFKLLEKIMPDFILLDVDMPEMDGFEALQALKADEKFKSIPVAFLSGTHDAEHEKRGAEMGAVGFYLKPFSPEFLIEKIETHTKKETI